MHDRIVTDANGRKYINNEPRLHKPRSALTKEQATAIFRMARELEDTGRLCSLSEDTQSRMEWWAKNKNVQCALQDYLHALVYGTESHDAE